MRIHSGYLFHFHDIIDGFVVSSIVSLYDIIINNDFDKLQFLIEKEIVDLIPLLIHGVIYKNEYFTNYLLLLLEYDRKIDELSEEQKDYIEKVKRKFNFILEL